MESIIYIGMDVHKDTYSLCSYNPKQNTLFAQVQVKSETGNVVRYLEKVSEQNGGALTVCGYEAGPTGFGLCRYAEPRTQYNRVVARTVGSSSLQAKEKEA